MSAHTLDISAITSRHSGFGALVGFNEACRRHGEEHRQLCMQVA